MGGRFSKSKKTKQAKKDQPSPQESKPVANNESANPNNGGEVQKPSPSKSEDISPNNNNKNQGSGDNTNNRSISNSKQQPQQEQKIDSRNNAENEQQPRKPTRETREQEVERERQRRATEEAVLPPVPASGSTAGVEKRERPKKNKEEEAPKKPKPTMEEIRDTIPGPVMEAVRRQKVKSAAQLNSAETGSTSKLHKFSPVVSIEEALTWVADQGPIDAVIVLTDESTLHIKDAVFEEFEDMSDV